MGEGITLNTISPRLEDDQFRFTLSNKLFNYRPCFIKQVVIGKWRHWYIERSIFRFTRTCLFCCTSTGIEKATVLMDIGVDKIRVGFKGIKNTIAMMGVDINIGNSADSLVQCQILNQHPDIVENAKAGH